MASLKDLAFGANYGTAVHPSNPVLYTGTGTGWVQVDGTSAEISSFQLNQMECPGCNVLVTDEEVEGETCPIDGTPCACCVACQEQCRGA